MSETHTDHEIAACPFPSCGDTELTVMSGDGFGSRYVQCMKCGYRGRHCDTEAHAVEAHNNIARMVRAGEKLDKMPKTADGEVPVRLQQLWGINGHGDPVTGNMVGLDASGTILEFLLQPYGSEGQWCIPWEQCYSTLKALEAALAAAGKDGA